MIKGVQLIKTPTYIDDRGHLSVLFDKLQIDNIKYPKINRVYFVGNFGKNVIRAFHKHKKNWDCFFISCGAAKFVLVDDRKESPTYKEKSVFVMSEKNPSILIVPPGVWHGWMSLKDKTHLFNMASESLEKETPDEERIPADSFNDVWTVKGR